MNPGTSAKHLPESGRGSWQTSSDARLARLDRGSRFLSVFDSLAAPARPLRTSFPQSPHTDDALVLGTIRTIGPHTTHSNLPTQAVPAAKNIVVARRTSTQADSTLVQFVNDRDVSGVGG